FDERYLELPDEVLATVMIKHQRFFPTRKETGEGKPGPLARHFVGVSNNRVDDEALVRKGYEQVLGGRLYDARFFWDADRAKSLSQHAWGLSGIAFQKELGSMADKTARVGAAAQLLVDALGVEPGEIEALERALPVFRADLATDMVYEFPELEGVMGRAYALAEGMSPAAADALLGGVLPRSHADDVPATAAGAVLSVADRLDKLVGFFALGKRPSGSADPFALRRDGVAVARIAAAHGWRVPLATLVEAAAAAYRDGPVQVGNDTIAEVTAFVWDRVGSLLVDLGAPVQVVRAAVGGSLAVIGAARRAALLRALMERPDFADLMALYKRAANLAKAAEPSEGAEDESLPEERVRDELFRESEEAPLLAALPAARSGAQALLSAVADQLPAWDLARAMASGLTGLDAAVGDVVSLKAPLDAFLDGVLVMDDDERVRRNRLAMLAAVVDVLRQLGALEELEGA
ncbi:MAG: glycine--tRNA ligase subunit beta, partial [Trueperaceae bacterium]